MTNNNEVQKGLAKRLLRRNASVKLVGHVTRLGRSAIQSLASETVIDADVSPAGASLDYFYLNYGAFKGVTVDTLRFVDAIEVSGVNPDEAFRDLREKMVKAMTTDTTKATVAMLTVTRSIRQSLLLASANLDTELVRRRVK